MSSFAARRRHLSPHADNPFAALEVDRIPVERARPVHVFTADQDGRVDPLIRNLLMGHAAAGPGRPATASG